MKNRHVWVALLLLTAALVAAGASSLLDAPVAPFPDSLEAGEPPDCFAGSCGVCIRH